MTATTPDLGRAIAAAKRRRLWSEALAMYVGGFVAVIGMANVSEHLFDTGQQLGMSVPVSLGVYGVGCLVFAWGGARGELWRWPVWFVATIVSGSLLVLAAAAVWLFALVAKTVVSDRFGTWKATFGQNIAPVVVQDADLEPLLGTPVRGPITLAWLPTTAMWSGPSGRVAVGVRHSVRLARRLGSRDQLTRKPSSKYGELATFRTTRDAWVVTVKHRSGSDQDVAAMARIAATALDRLTQTG